MPDIPKKYLNPIDIPETLLEKYQKSGPRYTSYPTAPQFKTDFNTNEIKNLWKNSLSLRGLKTFSNDSSSLRGLKTFSRKGFETSKSFSLETSKSSCSSAKGLSIYSHFPFCKTRCLYCGCFTHIGESKEIQTNYVDALKRELGYILEISDSSRQIEQLAFGGGTPTHLPSSLLKEYVNFISSKFQFADNAERSIEIDPRSIDENYLDTLIELKFNRFSFGVQDLDEHVQKKINRILDFSRLEELLGYARKTNMEAINIDLIYGLPGQSPTSFSSTIKKVISLHPSRIALFGYAHVPWVSPHQKVLEKYTDSPIPDTKTRMEIFGTAYDLLINAGYIHIGMDHFALPNDELVQSLDEKTLTRNFMGYTTRRGLDLIGIGASSISSVGNTYTQNNKDLLSYINHQNDVHWQKALILSTEDILRREIIINLFCNFYLDTTTIEKKFDISFGDHFKHECDSLKVFEDDGMLQWNNQELIVTELGRFFIRNICMTFDQYLAKESQIPETRYSKTL